MVEIWQYFIVFSFLQSTNHVRLVSQNRVQGFPSCNNIDIYILFRSIRRIIFYSLVKPVINEDGDKEMDVISISQALQIAGKTSLHTWNKNMTYHLLSSICMYL